MTLPSMDSIDGSEPEIPSTRSYNSFSICYLGYK